MQSTVPVQAGDSSAPQTGGWNEGYVTAVDYPSSYFGELNPVCVALALLQAGLVPPQIQSVCELGFGQGVSIGIHAAGSRHAWYGTDFNPAHAAFAQSLAAASGSGARLFEQSFAEFCSRADLPDFDFICLHGVWSWISQENRRVIVDFARRKLRVGGVLYLSYNTQPGWAGMMPIRDLLARHVDVMAARGPGVVAGIEGAFAFAEKVLSLAPGFTLAHPFVSDWLKGMSSRDGRYLAHEYLNRDWHPMPFAELAEWLTEAKVTFAAPAAPLDRITALNLTSEQQALLAEIPDAVFRESVQDFMVNRQFRRDYWVKGPRRLSPAERLEAIRPHQVVLATHRADVSLKVTGALGEADLTGGVYDRILDTLADHKPTTIGQVADLMQPKGLQFDQVCEALTILHGKGTVFPVQDDAAQVVAATRAEKLNRYIIDKSRGSRGWSFLASPVTGGGIPVSRPQQLFLLARARGQKTPDEWAQTVWQIFSAQNEVMIKDGRTLQGAAENLAELTAQAREFAAKRLPVLTALQIA